MGILTQYNSDIGGIDDSLLSLISKIGNTPLTTTATDLSSAINELNNNKADKSGDTLSGDLLNYKDTTVPETSKVITQSTFSDDELSVEQNNFIWTGEDWVIGAMTGVKITTSDIRTMHMNSWDGEHYSLKDTLANKVNKSGDTISGTLEFTTTNPIKYTGSYATYDMIKFKDGTDVNGNGIIIGGGGLTIIGSGESHDTTASQYASGGSEDMLVTGDNEVHILTNLNLGYSDRKTFVFGADGKLTVPNSINANFGTYSVVCDAAGGTSGYFRYATVKVTGTYVNGNIRLLIGGRGILPTVADIRFANTSGLDPDLGLWYEGPRPIYAKKTATSTWDLYIAKEEAYGKTIVTVIGPGQLICGGLVWTWKNEAVSSLPSGYITGTNRG